MYRFARYSQDGNRSHFLKCSASRTARATGLPGDDQGKIEVLSVEPIRFSLRKQRGAQIL
jgi:hypothetical protein